MLLTKSCMGPSLHLPRQTTTIDHRAGRLVLLAFLTIFYSFSNLNAQFYKPSAISKEVGDTLPAAFFETIHQAVNARTGEGTTVKLADYKDKLIILDFWATWCKPCIGSLNKLDSMRAGMDATGFVVFPVTYQTPKEAAPAFERFHWDMNSIVSDTTLSQIFPHSGIPHQVWIKDGKVMAIPLYAYATRENIENTISGRKVVFRSEQKDFDFDTFVNKAIIDNDRLYSSAILKGNPNYYQQRPLYAQRDGKTFLFMGNVDLVTGLYGFSFASGMAPHFGRLGKNNSSGIYIETNDSLKKMLLEPKPMAKKHFRTDSLQVELDEWMKRNYYSYQLVINATISQEDAYRIMRDDLNALFGVKMGIIGQIEKRPKKIALLRTLNGKEHAKELLRSIGGAKVYDLKGHDFYTLRNQQYISVPSLIYKVKILSADIPLIDSTGIGNKEILVDFKLSLTARQNLSDANHQLARYGLKIDVVERMEPVLVIREIGRDRSTDINVVSN